MPDTGFLGLSLLCVAMGISFILFPHALLSASQFLNRTLVTLDQTLVRYRYAMGVLFVVGGYALFQIALLLPH